MNFRRLAALLSLFIFFVCSALRFSVKLENPLAISFDLGNNVPLVEISANGSPPLSFILDTGAGDAIISGSRAKE